MPIRFRCPRCDRNFKAPDSAAGTDVSCPACSTLVLLPEITEDDDPPPSRRSEPAAPYREEPAPQGVGLAVAGMILGIIGFVVAPFTCFGWILGALLGVLGIVFSSVGIGQTVKAGRGKGIAFTGLILSILALFWGPVIDFLALGALGAFMAAAAGSRLPPPRPNQSPAPPAVPAPRP